MMPEAGRAESGGGDYYKVYRDITYNSYIGSWRADIREPLLETAEFWVAERLWRVINTTKLPGTLHYGRAD